MPDHDTTKNYRYIEMTKNQKFSTIKYPEIDQATAFVDSAAIVNNIKIAQSIAPAAKIMAVVKANGYGHGMVNVAKILAPYIHGYAVARYEEAQTLRDQSITKEILIMSPTSNLEQLHSYPSNNYIAAVHTLEMLEFAQKITDLNYWVKIDTGMHRLGISRDNTHLLFDDSTLNTRPKAIMTHFSEAQKEHSIATNKQMQHFINVFEKNDINAFSVSNSAAIMINENSDGYPQWQLQKTTQLAGRQEFIRPGIMIYGIDPLDKANQTSLELQPAMTFTAPIISIKPINAGESVGYNSKWIASKKSIIATIAVGYADGYPRHAKNGTPVLVNGKLATLVGAVSMDSLSVDITDHHEHIKIGDTAILWGKELPINIIARHANTIAYDLMTAIAERVAREII